MSCWDIWRDILYGMHGRWKNRSLVIYCIETDLWSVKGIQISDPSSEATPATPTRSCPAFTTPRCLKGCTSTYPVTQFGTTFFVYRRHDRFLDIDKNRVLALVAHSPHTLELTGNYAQATQSPYLLCKISPCIVLSEWLKNARRKHAIRPWSAFISPIIDVRMNIIFSLLSWEMLLPLKSSNCGAS